MEDLKAQGLLVKEEPHEAQVGHSDRSKTAIEPYLSDQWFVKMAPLAEPALEVVRDGKIKFFPERHAQQYLAGSARSATGRSRGSCGGGIGFRCGRGRMTRLRRRWIS